METILKRAKKGVSMVSLVVAVVVIIILALVAYGNSTKSVGNANRSTFVQELKDIEEGVANKRITNQIAGTGEEILNKGFYKVKVVNPPASFTSFDKKELTGYVVDLELVQFEDSLRGQKYKEYKEGLTERVNFGKDDVYIYDANGIVYYAKGVEIENILYYSSEELSVDGPVIVSKMVKLSANKKSAKIEVVVRPSKEGNVTTKIGDKLANVISENGNEKTFSITVYENKTYMIVATEEGNGESAQSIDVTEIDTPTYQVVYNANGGINEPPEDTKTENITLILSLQSPIREGYTFIGWSTRREATLAEYMPGSEFTSDENTTLYAVWVKGEKTYNVLYSANGGIGAPPAEFNIKETYTISLQTPKKEGYGFDGWSKDSKATSAEYHPGDVISMDSDVELYAVWISKAQTIMITVEPEGAGTVVGNGAKQKGENVVIAATAKDGYQFENWKVTSGAVNLASTVSSTTSFAMPAEDVSIVANFKVMYLTLKYNANGGYSAPVTQRGAKNSTIQIAGTQPTREGYKFLGWALKSAATEADYNVGETLELKENIVLYAVWEKNINQYTLSFDLNGGAEETIGDFAPITTNEGEEKQIPEKEPFKNGLTFLGWTLEKSSKDIVYRPGDVFKKDRNTTLFAVFTDVVGPEIKMNVRYDNELLVLEAEAFDDGIIAGYKWTTTNETPTSWNTDGTGNTTIVKENSSITKGENYFWAKDYEGNISSGMIMVYEVVYDANGGDNPPTRQLKAHGVPLTLSSSIPTRNEFKFLGWSTSVNPDNTLASVAYDSEDTYEMDANITLKAVWGKTSFELSSYLVNLAVGEPAEQITIIKSLFTGELKVTSSNEKAATVEIVGDILKIIPGTAAGESTINVTESTMGTSRKIIVRVEKGQRTITLTKDTFSFIYGDEGATTVISYEGENTRTEIISTNEDVATATANGYTITVTPHNFGTTKLTIVVSENEAYHEQTAEVHVVVAKKDLIVIPDAGQNKVYDKTTSTPELTYTYTGQIKGETPKFEGALSRAAKKDVGTYKIELGNLKLIDNDTFKEANYKLILHETTVNFEITPMFIKVPDINTPQMYDGTEKCVIEESVDYKRGGVYIATDANIYNLELSLADTKNTLWEDSKNTAIKNFTWEITPYSLADGVATGRITINEISTKVYTGEQILPSITMKFDGTKLVQGKDYNLNYTNNVKVGTATITITGIGNYKGTTTTTFKIANAVMQVDAYGYEGIYDGAKHKITVNVSKPTSGATIYYSETKLTESNYTTGSTTNLEYEDVCAKTIYYYIVAPNYGEYAGNSSIKITSKEITSEVNVSGIQDKVYTGAEITQSGLIVKDTTLNKNLVLNKDYTVTYADNKDVGIGRLAIKGIGNYTGTINKSFRITGDTITITKDTEDLANVVKVSIKKTLSMTTLQYSFDNSSWTAYTETLSITRDGIIYARTIDINNENKVIGTAQIEIENICQHEYIDATCIKAAYCGLCGNVNGDPLGHSYTQELVGSRYLNAAATCTTNAIYNKKCVRCSEFTTTSTFEAPDTALGHDYNCKSGIVATVATCTEPEYCYFSCRRCDIASTNTYANGDPLGHDSENPSTQQRSVATCTEAATYYYSCSRCDIVSDTSKYYTSGKAEGHLFETQTQKYLRTPATCTEKATYYYECTRCEVSSKNNDGSYYTCGSTIDHTFESEMISDTYLKTEANCVDLAVYYYKCKGCDAKGTDTYTHGGVDSSNHVGGTTRNYIAPTTLAEGREWYTCNSCGVTISDTVIPKLSIYAVMCADNVLEFNTTGTSTRGQSLKAPGMSWVVTGTYTSAFQVPWHDYAATITGVQVTEAISPQSTAYWFYGCTNLTSVGDLSKLDTSIVTNMTNMFYGCSKLTSLDISDLNSTNVTRMVGMFNGCSSLTSLVLSSLNTVKVTDMNAMFKDCSSLLTLDISTFTTTAVTNMKEIFSGCSKLTTINLGNVSTANVTNMSYMFNNCTALTSVTVTGFNTAKVTNMMSMFYGCSALTTLDLSSFNTSAVTGMANMFGNCSSLEKIYASVRFVTTSVTDDGLSMFLNDTKLTGGSGTTYSDSNVDKTYARIDGGAANPGYFWSTVECAHVFESKENHYLKASETCTNSAVYYYECTECGISSEGITDETYSSGNPLGHSYTVLCLTDTYIKSVANCASGAIYYYKCERCTAKGTSEHLYGDKDKTNHVGGTTEHIIEATETTPGRKWTTCNGCGEELSSETIQVISAKAVYYAEDNSLRFYKNTDVVTAGEDYKGRKATAVYTGIETITNTTYSAPWYEYRMDVTSVYFEDKITPLSTAGWFYEFENTPQIDLTNLDTTEVTCMNYMFSGLGAKVENVSLDVSGFNTSKVTDMEMVFSNLGLYSNNIEIIGLEKWDTSAVINMTGIFQGVGYNEGTIVNVTGFENWDTTNVVYMTRMFHEYCVYNSVDLDLSAWKTAKVTDMESMFSNVGSLSSSDSSINVAGWDTGNVTNMSAMFSRVSKHSQINIVGLENWNVEKVTNMSWLFNGAGDIGDLSAWNPCVVTDMSYMFQNLKSKWVGKIGNWSTSSVTNMSYMFSGAEIESFTSGEILKGDISLDGIVNGYDEFLIKKYFVDSFTLELDEQFAADVDKNGVVDTTDYLRVRGYTLGNLRGGIIPPLNWDTANVTNMSGMFSKSKIKRLDLMSFDTSNVIAMNGMFDEMKELEFVNLSPTFEFVGTASYLPIPSSENIIGATGVWYDLRSEIGYLPENIPSYTGGTYSAKMLTRTVAIYSSDDNGLYFYKISYEEMPAVGDVYDERVVTKIYSNVGNTSEIPWRDIRTQVTNVQVKTEITPKYMASWFENMTNLSSIDLKLVDTSNVYDMKNMFSKAGYNCETFTITGLEKWDVSKVTNMSGMFSEAGNSATSWTIGNLSGWNVSYVTNMSWMFKEAGESATSWTIGDIDDWIVVNVKNMSSMFASAGNWATSWTIGNLSGWNVSNVTNMSNMFASAGNWATSWTVGNLSGWNVSNVTNMSNMFAATGQSATSWSIGDISEWDVSKVADMSGMFKSAGESARPSWTIGNIGGWNVSSVIDMSDMFYGAGCAATSWTIGDLSGWNVSSVIDMSNMFHGAGCAATSWTIGDLSGWTVSKVTDMESMFEASGLESPTWTIGDISEWDVSNVTTMSHMFKDTGYSATNWYIGDISQWNVSSVADMCYMFYSLSSGMDYQIDLRSWDVGQTMYYNGFLDNISGPENPYSNNSDDGEIIDNTSGDSGDEESYSRIIPPIWVY